MRSTTDLRRHATRRFWISVASGAVAIFCVIASGDRGWTAAAVVAGFLAGFNFILSGAAWAAAKGELILKDKSS